MLHKQNVMYFEGIICDRETQSSAAVKGKKCTNFFAHLAEPANVGWKV